MTGTTLLVLAGVVAVVAVISLLLIRRVRYVEALTSRGWTFTSAPDLGWVLDHHAPPFGLGLEREVDEGVEGTTRSGVPFRVFEYTVSGGPRFDARLASVRLPLPLPRPGPENARPPAAGRWRRARVRPHRQSPRRRSSARRPGRRVVTACR